MTDGVCCLIFSIMSFDAGCTAPRVSSPVMKTSDPARMIVFCGLFIYSGRVGRALISLFEIVRLEVADQHLVNSFITSTLFTLLMYLNPWRSRESSLDLSIQNKLTTH